MKVIAFGTLQEKLSRQCDDLMTKMQPCNTNAQHDGVTLNSVICHVLVVWLKMQHVSFIFSDFFLAHIRFYQVQLELLHRNLIQMWPRLKWTKKNVPEPWLSSGWVLGSSEELVQLEEPYYYLGYKLSLHHFLFMYLNVLICCSRPQTSELGVTEHVEGDPCKFALWVGRTPTSDNKIVLKVLRCSCL